MAIKRAKSAKKGQLVKRGKDAGSYYAVLEEISELLQFARRTSARAVNTIMTAAYLRDRGRVVEYE